MFNVASYLTFDYLRNNRQTLTRFYDLNESRSRSDYTTKVFLSHKHSEDRHLINSVKGFFKSYGAEIYIDWQDERMPTITNIETAKKLKYAIDESEKFVVLATPESIKSIWIPWEIGLADTLKGISNMALLPILNSQSDWEKREYYNLYSRIGKVNSGWSVIKPENDYTGVPLKDWLKS